MEIDRNALLAILGAKPESISHEERAEALERYLLAQLDKRPAVPGAGVRRGVGAMFGGPGPRGQPGELIALAPMPERPTLLDFFERRFAPRVKTHLLQSGTDALRKGQPEEIVFACLLHDIAINLLKVDHGWWGAQMLEPYVAERVSWAIRNHQALRFYADSSVGYEYPQQYIQIFGEGYVPAPYIQATYEHARNHKWYMDARMITVHDLYAFDPNMQVSLDPFVDIIGRHFKQPKQGLGFDGSPVAHMWRSLMYPENPL